MTDGINSNAPRISTNEAIDADSFDKKANRGGKVFVNIKSNGQMDHNIDTGKLDKGQQAMVKDALLPLANASEELRALIAEADANGEYGLAAELHKELENVIEQMQTVKNWVEKSNGEPAPGDYNDSNKMAAVPRNFADFDSSISEIGAIALSRAGDLGQSVRDKAMEKLGISAENFAAQVGMPPAQVEGPATGQTGDAGGAEGEGDVVWATQMMTNPDDAIAQFENDPDGFFSKLKDLNASDRQGVIMTLQNEMQANNQLQSTLSNFLKALHDTDKAIIQNLRV